MDVTGDNGDEASRFQIRSPKSLAGEEGGGGDLTAKDVVEAATPGVLRDSPSPSSMDGTKGKGLKKWKRMRRAVPNESSPPVVDSGKVLKRGFLPPPDTGRSHPPDFGINQTSKGSVGSVPTAAPDDLLLGRDSGFRVSIGPGFAFAAGNSWESSEDRGSSKSSTAASAPKPRMAKNLGGKGVANSVQQQQQSFQQGKAWVEGRKKAREERVKLEKENSQSSVESDSRSSMFVFAQGASSSTTAASNNGISGNDHGEDSNEQQHPNNCFCSENAGGDEAVSKGDSAAGSAWEAKEKRSEDHQPGDPLVDSLHMLQSVQDALEREVKKFREIGLEHASPHGSCSKSSSPLPNFTCADDEICETGSSDQLASKGRSQNGSYSLEGQLLSQKERVNLLESKLEAATAMLKVKESKVIDLEADLDNCKAQIGELGCTEDSRQECCRTESEIECLLKQKIESEVEYFVTTRTMQEVIVATLDNQGTLADEQALKFPKLQVAGSKTEMQKKQVESLNMPNRADILDTEEVLRMQKKVCKITLCFFIQLVLLAVVFGLLVLKFLQPHSVEVPT